MSIKSYQRNVEKGVVGPYDPVCYPAAIEQVSRFGYNSDIYQAYLDYVDRSDRWNEQQRREHVFEFEDLIEKLVKPLGGLSFRGCSFQNYINC
jgi:hypothetical protein